MIYYDDENNSNTINDKENKDITTCNGQHTYTNNEKITKPLFTFNSHEKIDVNNTNTQHNDLESFLDVSVFELSNDSNNQNFVSSSYDLSAFPTSVVYSNTLINTSSSQYTINTSQYSYLHENLIDYNVLKNKFDLMLKNKKNLNDYDFFVDLTFNDMNNINNSIEHLIDILYDITYGDFDEINRRIIFFFNDDNMSFQKYGGINPQDSVVFTHIRVFFNHSDELTYFKFKNTYFDIT